MADFLDKISGGIDKGIKVVSSKSKELLETAKLRGEMREVEDTIETRFNALGKRVYGMINKSTLAEEDIKTDCAAITSLYGKFTELEGSIKRVEQESLKLRYGADAIICQKCGAPNKSGDKFCGGCGSVLSVETKSEGRNCPACATPAKEGAKFCARCGGKLG